jgi:hypothetical protein
MGARHARTRPADDGGLTPPRDVYARHDVLAPWAAVRAPGPVRRWSSELPVATALVLMLAAADARTLGAMTPVGASVVAGAASSPAETLRAAHELFYNGQYAEAVEATRTTGETDDDLELIELRTSALLFQIKRAMGDANDKDKAFKACSSCAELVRTFKTECGRGQALARAAVAQRPNDATALFYLGKLDLNYVWLELGTLGHRTGWNEYWEARHSLDESLVLEPEFRRTRVARAWIDYIVDTRMPWGTGWLLGGGNKKKALAVMRDAAASGDDRYAHAEALFGLWDMQVREKRTADALESAKRLVVMFPNNPEVARFVASGARGTRN